MEVNDDKIVCQVCLSENKEYRCKKLTSQHLKRHQLSVKEYEIKFQVVVNKKRIKNFNKKKRHNDGLCGVDYVICEICKKDSKDFKFDFINQTHLKTHSITIEEYKTIYSSQLSIKKNFTKQHKDNISKSRIRGIESGEIKSWCKGKKFSDKHKNNISKSRIEKHVNGNLKIWNKGLTKKTDQRIVSYTKKGVETQKRNGKNSGINNPMFGKTLKDVWNEKYGEYQTVRLIEERNKQRINKIKNGEIRNPALNYGKKFNNTACELKVEKMLIDFEIFYTKQFHVYDEIEKKTKIYDFHLPNYNILIEVDGLYWHCKLKEKPPNWEKIQENDLYKNMLAKRKNFKLIRIREDEIDKIWEII